MPRQYPDRDEAPDVKGFFERDAAWLDSNNLEYGLPRSTNNPCFDR